MQEGPSGRHRVSRRGFISRVSGLLLAVTSTPGLASRTVDTNQRARIITGAIRWDAWYRNTDFSIGAQRNLSTVQHYERAPFFCSVDTQFQVTCTGTAEEMDHEIQMAVAGGLKYWAFVWYDSQSSFRTAWNLYNNSVNRHRIHWCGIVELSYLGSVPFENQQWQKRAAEWAEHMREPHYQKVDVTTPGRPLLFLLWDSRHLKYHFDDKISNVRICLDYLQRLLASQGTPAAYIVVQIHPADSHLIAEIGADAIGAYIPAFRREPAGLYQELATQTEAYWQLMAATKLPTVPTAMVGWDTRARSNKPPPNALSIEDYYYNLPTPDELRSHLAAAVDFTRHEAVCESKALLIYSWNECDEGGGLVPTLGDRTGSYLAAIAPVIAG